MKKEPSWVCKRCGQPWHDAFGHVCPNLQDWWVDEDRKDIPSLCLPRLSERDLLKECIIRDSQSIEMFKRGDLNDEMGIEFFAERLAMYRGMLEELHEEDV